MRSGANLGSGLLGQSAAAGSGNGVRAAGDEIDSAAQLLHERTLTATTFTVATAALIRDAGTNSFERPALQMRADTGNAGIGAARAAVELAFAFHYAVTGDQHGTDGVVARLGGLTAGGDYGYYLDISCATADRTADPAISARWIDDEQSVRGRRRAVVTARQAAIRAR
ncbi:hypothetical protein K353_03380 [Kitasatospora sp. SolWspMP-SS2h]|uniref:hypothetical protein n=1 Tax=Kitasatospora sp. SolWspMP-SS2h TaxID=1305729 RepID=UPI000DB9A7DA|nr:hypothetical protein [Kitasatospora sp. SolWspMP-SS2h]RAJ40488.1 hypothetical protein K353_03380 [Kitasatospora sp. SolWspMP-SS2h]